MYYSIDIGETNIRILGTDDLDLFELAKIIKLKNTGIYGIDYKSIVEIIQARPTEEINSIAIGFAGDISKDGRTVETSKIDEWENNDFVKELEKEFDTKVYLRSSSNEPENEHSEIITGFELLKNLQ